VFVGLTAPESLVKCVWIKLEDKEEKEEEKQQNKIKFMLLIYLRIFMSGKY
jgi:hypothetical protein